MARHYSILTISETVQDRSNYKGILITTYTHTPHDNVIPHDSTLQNVQAHAASLY